MVHLTSTPDESEWSLIFDSWARSWMKSPWSGTFRNCDWDDASRKASQELVDRPTTRVVVAYGFTEAGVRRVKGYIVYEPARRIIHWLYTKRDFRGQGVARQLLAFATESTERSTWVYTHRTNACSRLFRGMKHDKSYACTKG